jgi:predicted alpha/beta superfamily hydrolase
MVSGRGRPYPAQRPGGRPNAGWAAGASRREHHAVAGRELDVYLPAGYDADPRRRYSVLYMQDGQNIAEVSPFVGQGWQLPQTANRLAAAGEVEPLILVGVYNSLGRRRHDYLPPSEPPPGGSGADAYGRLLVEQVKPFIDWRYRTLPGRANTGLGGSSLGGLISLYLGIRYPEVYGKLAVLSPARGQVLLSLLADLDPSWQKPATRIWLDMGTGPREDPSMARALRDVLVERGWELGVDLQYYHAEGGLHDERAWAQRVPLFLRFLWPA